MGDYKLKFPVLVCVCERERESVGDYKLKFPVLVCVCVCVCERERECG